jgi:hypothetical protein
MSNADHVCQQKCCRLPLASQTKLSCWAFLMTLTEGCWNREHLATVSYSKFSLWSKVVTICTTYFKTEWIHLYQYISITQTNQSMLLRETITVYCENQMYKYTVWAKC